MTSVASIPTPADCPVAQFGGVLHPLNELADFDVLPQDYTVQSRTKIVATVGPSCSTAEHLARS